MPTSLLPSPSTTRRRFLAGSGAALAAAAARPVLSFAPAGATLPGGVVVVIFLRGGADGLSLVAPWDMPSYRSRRPTIRVRTPDEFADPAGRAGLPLEAGGAVAPFALSGVLALHPGLAALHQGAWVGGDLAVVHAAGMPASESDTRSHFDSMRNWELGSASSVVSTGFLNRFLTAIDATDQLPAVSRGTGLARSLSGPVPAYSMAELSSFGVSGFSSNSRARAALTSWYDRSPGDLLGTTGANTLGLISAVTSVDWAGPAFAPRNGATYGDDDIARNLREVAKLVRSGLGLRVACIDAGGWDTHEGMGAPDDPGSYFRRRAGQLGDALAAFRTDLGAELANVTVVTISEFGRTIDENGSGGTDHGRGSCLLVMGGGIRGGVHGDFVDAITDGPEGDLAVVNDWRRVLAEVLTVRGGAPSVESVFPTWSPQTPLGICG